MGREAGVEGSPASCWVQLEASSCTQRATRAQLSGAPDIAWAVTDLGGDADQDWNALTFATPAARDARDVVLAAIKHSWRALQAPTLATTRVRACACGAHSTPGKR